MKKNKLNLLFFTVLFAVLFCSVFSASAAYTTEKCTGESVEVATFDELKTALESFKPNANVVLKSDIAISDNSRDCAINLSGNGAVTIDLKGRSITVKSNKTKTLFDITGQTRLYFVNSSENKTTPGESKRSVIYFNTTASGAALVRANNSFCQVNNVNVDFTMGHENAYKETVDSSDTAVFYINKATGMNIYSGSVRNFMRNGNGVVIAANDINKQKLSFRIGGKAEVGAYKYSVSFNPSNVKYVKFGSVSFEKIDSPKGTFERINVPSGSSVTLSDLWYTSEAGSGVTVRNGGLFPEILSKKVTSLDKDGNVTAVKTCETLSNTKDYIALQCSGGHVRLCGTCYMSYNGIEAHTTVKEQGREANCTLSGKTAGEKCTVCAYSSSKEIPKLGHDMVYTKGVEASCGVDGKKEHYYCKNCKGYYADSDGAIKLNRDEIVTPNDHVIRHIPETPATCTATGLTAGIVCETCGKVTKKQEIIPAKGHTEVNIYSPVEASCSREGRTAGKKCSVCEVVLVPSEVIPQKPHTTEIIDGYPASCTLTGLTYGEVCVVCSYVVIEQEIIPAKGHIEMIIEGKKATCVEDGLTDGLACESCGLIIKEQEKIMKGAHAPKLIEGKKATCKEEGLTDGSICEVCGIVLEKQEIIPVNDEHKESVIKGTPATCTNEGKTDGIECSLCKKILSPQDTIPKLPHTEKVVKGTAPTCSKEGLTDEISCAVCSFVIEKQTAIPKTPHTEKVVEGTEATCKNEGVTDSIVCGVCGEVITEGKKTEKLPHTEKIVKGTEATCEKEGLSDGIVCSVCSETVKEQTVLPKKAHTVSTSVVRADFKNSGEITETCAVCKKLLGKKEIGRIVSVKLSVEKYTYNGKAKKPSVIVKTSTGETLQRYKDFNVTYPKGRKAIGTYEVKVSFIGNYSGEKTLNFTVRPNKTDKITVKQSETSIKLSWNKVEGATGYRVYLYNTKTKKYKTLGTTEKLSCTIKKLKAGTVYKFAVKAYTKTEEGNLWSKYYTELETATKPAVPSVKGKADTAKASLSWKEVSGATGYVVYMSEKKDSGYKKMGATKKLSCSIKKLKKGKTYYFKVKAYTKVDGKNIYSGESKVVAVKVK